MQKKFAAAFLFLSLFFLVFLSPGSLFAEDPAESTFNLPDDVSSYQLNAADKVLLAEPAVCFVTTVFYARVLDPFNNTWSDFYYQGISGTGFVVNPQTGHIVTACLLYTSPSPRD